MRAFDLADAVHQQGLGEHAVDGLARMQRAVGVLEHHLHAAEEVLAALGLLPHARDRDLALPFAVEAGERAQHRGFARPALAHEPEARPGRHAEADRLSPP